ncbi:MAG: methyltransferase domain-containing protein [Pirellulales bacterium]|nr:methyltransferase domain-containing protein [Pirellulales bacterium]
MDDLIVLADGTRQDLGRLSRDELAALQWRQEQEFAARILATSKGSAERADTVRQAYETVTRLYAAAWCEADQPLVMGCGSREARFVVRLLERQARRGRPARLFEIGYSGGVLLKRVSDAGFPVAGIEVSPTLREQAVKLLGSENAASLHVGDFLQDDLPGAEGPFGVVYWNDVFEHLLPDETHDYLRRIHSMLAPGGCLVTITPNWHRRPSDITRVFCPPRTEAAGLHLREYTLRQMVAQLHSAGFRRVATPLLATPDRLVVCGRGGIGLKRFAEPLLERLPFRLAQLLCRGLALSTTIAIKDA